MYIRHAERLISSMYFWGSFGSKIHYFWHFSEKNSWQPYIHAARVYSNTDAPTVVWCLLSTEMFDTKYLSNHARYRVGFNRTYCESSRSHDRWRHVTPNGHPQSLRLHISETVPDRRSVPIDTVMTSKSLRLTVGLNWPPIGDISSGHETDDARWPRWQQRKAGSCSINKGCKVLSIEG